MSKTSAKKGTLLEKVVANFCSGIEGATVTHNTKLKGIRTGKFRQIDVLIEGKQGPFNVRIEVETKNHSEPVDIELVEAFATKIEDTQANVGVMVCPAGFTEGARSTAEAYGIQLFEITSEKLGNSTQLIPVRMVIASPKGYAVRIRETSKNPFYIPMDLGRVRVLTGGKEHNLKQVMMLMWNDGRIPHKKGKHDVEFGTIKMLDTETGEHQYCELSYVVEVDEAYLLKLYPTNYIRNALNKRTSHSLNIDLYTDPEELRKHWKEFESMESLNAAADIENQPEDIRGLIVQPIESYIIDEVTFP